MMALDHGHPWARSLRAWVEALPERPTAVLSVSAHWWTPDLRITAAEQPGIVHDFFGFPDPLYALDYPAPGAPDLAARIGDLLAAQGFPVAQDAERPLDHGTWAVLRHAWPQADLPVLQLSLPRWSPERLHALGRALAPLRDEGVLILGSGGLVHNLRRLVWEDEGAPVEPWAEEAEAWIVDRLLDGHRDDLFHHRERAPRSAEAAPTTEHLDPLFVAWGAGGDGPPTTVFDGWQHGTLSLRNLAWA